MSELKETKIGEENAKVTNKQTAFEGADQERGIGIPQSCPC
jgi:hypothetical protein